jgi:peptidoglycan-associated lipoprotein
MSRFALITITLCATVGVAACASSPQPAPVIASNAVQPRVTQTTPQAPAADVSANRAYIEVAESIRRACGLSEAEAYFAYDSSELNARSHTLLNRIATCFISGPLAGRHIALVGHADPRGDSEYNMLLGDRRAQAVNDALYLLLLPHDQTSTTSRGEMDATGTDEAGWAQDRRVQLELVE